MLEMRPTCLRCLRTAADCYCARIRSFVAPVRFVILQHPKEARNRLGTARMAKLCVENSVLVAGEPQERERRVNELVAEAPARSYLLYPGVGAIGVGEALERAEGIATIFVIDATWSMSKAMLRLSPALNALPKIAFAPARPSGYLFRRQPHPQFVSTIEAIHEVIETIDPGGQSQRNLLEVFDWMARRQSSYCAKVP